MPNVYHLTFCVGFTDKAHRDEFQAKVLAGADMIVSDLALKSRWTLGPDISTKDDKGYCWFTQDQVPVWASRLHIGFTDKTDLTAFQSALSAQSGAKDAKYAYFLDEAGKVGAFNVWVEFAPEPTDVSQVDVR